jgi:class 3 adenylate cyclase/tetratricopeptide (TPR) repeat protein
MPDAVACPRCGALNGVAQRFCGTCGNALAGLPVDGGAGQAAAPSDERRWVTVLFADIAGFTAMSEKLDFEEVRDVADRCAEIMGEEAARFGGTVLNVMGDAVMAVFGAPVAHDDDAERAVRAALAMVEAIPGKTPPEHNLALHVGVNTGDVMAGLLGPSGRRDYTVMGDTTNTAARLEAAAVRGEVVVGRETYLATRQAIRYQAHEPVTAKGKEEKVEAWLALEPLAERADRSGGSAPLAGREAELETLRGMWRRSIRDPRAQFATVIAPPGLGKTRLGREFAGELAAEGALVLRGRSLPYGEGTGYGPFADQVRAAAGITADMALAEAALALDAHVVEIFGDPEGEVSANLKLMLGLGSDGPGPDKNVLFFTARRWLAALARRRPTLLLYEDVHWADATLVELVGSVAARVGAVPVMILCLARPELMDSHPDWGAGQTAYSAITLEPLGPEAVRQISLALIGDASPAVVDRVVAAAGGNPLFIEELSATVSEQDGTSDQELPSTIKAVIGARLDLLPEPEGQLLLDAAVVGDVFWRGALAALGRVGEVDLVLDDLEHRGLVRHESTSTLAGEQQFIFKHALIREVAYGRLPRRTRRERHRVVAAYLEEVLGEQRDDQASLLAHHWSEAGDVSAAVRYHTVAGDRASSAWAKAEAIESYTHALDLASSNPDAGGTEALLVKRGRALAGAGDFQRAAADLDAALPSLTGKERALALLERGSVAFGAVDAEGMVRYGLEAVAVAEAIRDPRIAAAARALSAHASLAGGQLDKALDTASQAIEAWPLEGRDRDRDYADTVSTLALYHYWRGDYELAEGYARQAVGAGLALQALMAGNQGSAHLAMALVGQGRHEEALPWFEKSVSLGLDWEATPRFSSRSTNMWAGALHELMDWPAARELSERGRELGRVSGFQPAVGAAGIDLLLLDIVELRLGEAAAALPALWTMAHETKGFHKHLFEIRMADANAQLSLAQGRPEDGIMHALDAASRAAALPRRKYVGRATTTLARCLLAAGNTDDALARAEQAVAASKQLGHPHGAWRAADVLSRSRQAAGDDNGAGEAASSAADSVERFGNSLSAPRAAVFFSAREVLDVLARAGRAIPAD